MKNVVIVDGEILTPLGDLMNTWEGLNSGKSGLGLREFPTMTGRWPLGVIEALDENFGSWSRLQSMLDLLLARLPQLPENTQLFCATTKGAVDELIHNPNAGYGQPWQVADYIAKKTGIKGKATTVSGACASGTIAVIQGAMRINAGECDHAFIIGYDLLAKFVLSGFDSLKALSPTAAKPFDRHRTGLSLGEGAGWLLLSAEDKAAPQNKTMARLDCWSISCDATHITAPCRKASGLILALDKILSEGSKPIGGVNAHGTGTVYNDAMELLAFGQKCTSGTPVCSVKGALGHSLAAAGIVEVLLTVLSLQHGILPPTVGLEFTEESVCELSGEKALSLLHPSILTCNSGFGGINAAILLAH